MEQLPGDVRVVIVNALMLDDDDGVFGACRAVATWLSSSKTTCEESCSWKAACGALGVTTLPAASGDETGLLPAAPQAPWSATFHGLCGDMAKLSAAQRAALTFVIARATAARSKCTFASERWRWRSAADRLLLRAESADLGWLRWLLRDGHGCGPGHRWRMLWWRYMANESRRATAPGAPGRRRPAPPPARARCR